MLFIKNGLIVRSEKFNYHQNIGNVVDEAKRYSQWNVDELIYIDITRDGDYDLRRDDLKVKSNNNIIELLRQISEVCFMPLTFGGRIRCIEEMKLRIANGADKITINTGAYENVELIKKGSQLFGKQCIVVSIDYRTLNNEPIVFISNGRKNTGLNLYEWMKKVEALGAGEILLNSIDRDGMANGYDIRTIKHAAATVRIPVIAAGGAGDFFNFEELAKETGVSAVAAGNIFHFTENSYPRAKKYLIQHEINVRR